MLQATARCHFAGLVNYRQGISLVLNLLSVTVSKGFEKTTVLNTDADSNLPIRWLGQRDLRHFSDTQSLVNDSIWEV